MKIRSTFHMLVFLMAVLTFSMPFVTLAQQNIEPAEATTDAERAAMVAKAAADAERDAQADTDTAFWFIVGCFGSVLGFLYANYNVPTVPADRLIGKSPDYVTTYSSVYVRESKAIRQNRVVTGCVTSAIAGVVLSGCLIVTAGSTTPTASTTPIYY